MKRQTSSQKLALLPVPQSTIGAGNELGLSVMLDNQVEKYFLTSGSFIGSKVRKSYKVLLSFIQCLFSRPIDGVTVKCIFSRNAGAKKKEREERIFMVTFCG